MKFFVVAVHENLLCGFIAPKFFSNLCFLDAFSVRTSHISIRVEISKNAVLEQNKGEGHKNFEYKI